MGNANEYLVKILSECSDELLDTIAEIATMQGEEELFITIDDIEARIEQITGTYYQFLKELITKNNGKYYAFHFLQ